MRKKALLAIAIVLAILIIDQIIKIYIKTHFILHESYEVTSWFYLAFTENNGMAYGIEIFDKYLLTTFRIFAVGFFAYLLCKFIKKNLVSTGFVVIMSMIIAGAFGNIIDCVFYGKVFTDSYGHVAQFATDGLPCYGTWFKGLVVDMFYFPLFHFDWPQWFPSTHEIINLGPIKFTWPSWAPTCDRQFIFFSPVFNFADAAISVGVVSMLLFYPKSFMEVFSSINQDEDNSTK